METNGIKIGRRIKATREKIRMTQEELSIVIGCSPHYISAIERGVKSPRLETLIKIINALQLYPDILFQDIIDFAIDSNYDREFSSIVGWLPKEDKAMILRIVTTMSGELYDRRVRNIVEV